MKLKIFTALLLLVAVSCAPATKNSKVSKEVKATKEENVLKVNEDFFPEELKIYEGDHDIVRILVPLNNLNFNENQTMDQDDEETFMFMVQADDVNGEYVDQGLWARKGQNIKKLLPFGRDMAAPKDNSTNAFFVAKDGLYYYDSDNIEAVKYGTIDDDLVAIAMGITPDIMYVLNSKKEVFNITEEGTKKTKLENVINAEQIVLDYNKNLFYVDSNRDVFVLSDKGVKKIEGIPNDVRIVLLRPPFLLPEGIPIIAGKNAFAAYPDGKSVKENVIIDTEITAFSMEGAFVQYYALGEKIYEFNILALLLGSFVGELRDFLGDFKNLGNNAATMKTPDAASVVGDVLGDNN